jgi:hypothetical protein
MIDREVFLFPAVPISFLRRDQGVLHRFLCFPPPIINLGMPFLLRGRAVTPRDTVALIIVIKSLNNASNLGLTKF